MPKAISSCSFGKDSMAQIILALRHHEPLDEVIYCEVMFDDNISGEVPEHLDFIHGKAIPWLEKEGIPVTTIRGKHTYKSCFTSAVCRGKAKGKLRSFPLCGRCNIQRDCKQRVIERYMKTQPADVIQYIGYAKDEPKRLRRIKANQISLLEKYDCTEDDARRICAEQGLLSPVYEFSDRNGCWFCPNVKLSELRHLYDHHPELWRELLALQALPNKATEKFDRKYRFSDYDTMFRNEDAQLSWL